MAGSKETIDVTSGDTKLDSAVKNWLKWDKNSTTRTEVLTAVKNGDWDKLKNVMLSRIKFGTAGLRGAMKAGFKCMNDVIVLQTAQGLSVYFKSHCSEEQLASGIVVGFDGRYNSKRFAELTAKVFIANSIPVRLFSEVCPTPFISFATIHYGAVGGIMVTASHNPKEDNGYKVYWGNGSQIIAPHDDNILETILENLEIQEDHWDIENIRNNSSVSDPYEEIMTKYMKYIKESLDPLILKKNLESKNKIIYSAMHGVGYQAIKEAFNTASLNTPICVPEQRDPDPDFSTVTFPNPEEKECLKLSQRLAEKENAKLVLCNDPDADRLAVAEYNPSTKTWKVFSGNEMGALLGWWLLKQHKENCKTVDIDKVYFIASVVSSKMLKSIALEEGCHFIETLTGFKWMGNKTLLLLKEDKLPIFAFEEAIGYMCSARVPDKDGISAAVQVATLATELYSVGSSLYEKLQELYACYGYHVSHNAYYICHDQDIIKKIFERIRNYDGIKKYPKRVASLDITSVQDLTAGVTISNDELQQNGSSNSPTLEGTGLDLEYTSGEMIMFQCGSLAVTIRTSGTEPKIKYYTELVAPAKTLEEQEKVKENLVKIAQEFVEELLQPRLHGLI